MGSLALVQLTAAAVGNSVQRLNRKNDFRKVRQQQAIALQFHLDRVQHVHRVTFVAADQADELAVPVEHRPDTSAFRTWTNQAT